MATSGNKNGHTYNCQRLNTHASGWQEHNTIERALSAEKCEPVVRFWSSLARSGACAGETLCLDPAWTKYQMPFKPCPCELPEISTTRAQKKLLYPRINTRTGAFRGFRGRQTDSYYYAMGVILETVASRFVALNYDWQYACMYTK